MEEELKPVTVKDLIEYLKQFREDMPVAYQIYSESTILQLSDIKVTKLNPMRRDGWIHSFSDPRIEKIEYLLFPGN